MTKGRIGVLALIVGIVGIVLLAESALVLRVDQHAIIIQFGRPVRVLSEPGLYFMTPFVQAAHKLDKRTFEWDDEAQEVIMNDKKRLLINSFARWRISDPLKFYLAVRDERQAQLTLDKIVGAAVRDVLSHHSLDEVVRNSSRDLGYVSEDTQKAPGITKIAEGEGRQAIFKAIFERSQPELVETYGIDLIDVQLKQLNYTESAQQATIRNMISEREKVAATYEAQGSRQVLRIQGETQEKVRQLAGEAFKARLELEGQARSESTRIKGQAFGRAPELYAWLRTLELYEQTFDADTSLVLSTDTPLLRLLNDDGALDGSLEPKTAIAPPKRPDLLAAPAPAPAPEPLPIPEEPSAPEPAPVTP
jgi:membrane protease subunit HflC